jgi:hypothetical protein
MASSGLFAMKTPMLPMTAQIMSKKTAGKMMLRNFIIPAY